MIKERPRARHSRTAMRSWVRAALFPCATVAFSCGPESDPGPGVIGGAPTLAGGSAAVTGGANASTGGTIVASGGSSPSTGGAPDSGAGGATPSSGCGKPWAPAGVTVEQPSTRRAGGQLLHTEITVSGNVRQYLVVVPLNYDPNTPYPLVFGFHGSGGDRDQLRGYLNLEIPAGGRAIFIYPTGSITTSGSTGWASGDNSEDLLFVDALLEQYSGELCIDRQRVFVTGHSYGGLMTNTVGCYRGNVFRAIAPVAGGGPYGRSPLCVGEVAAMMIHSPLDTATQYSGAIASCTRVLRANHCQENPACGCYWVEALSSGTEPCIQTAVEPYVTNVSIQTTADDLQPPAFRQDLGCDAGYPLVFIDHYNGRDPRYHNPPSWAGAVIWEFLAGLPAR